MTKLRWTSDTVHSAGMDEREFCIERKGNAIPGSAHARRSPPITLRTSTRSITTKAGLQ